MIKVKRQRKTRKPREKKEAPTVSLNVVRASQVRSLLAGAMGEDKGVAGTLAKIPQIASLNAKMMAMSLYLYYSHDQKLTAETLADQGVISALSTFFKDSKQKDLLLVKADIVRYLRMFIEAEQS